MTRPYVGVSEFLMDQRNDEGNLWVPTFTTEYWAKQYLNWSQGIYSKDEIDAFFDGDDSKVQPVELGNQGDIEVKPLPVRQTASGMTFI